MINLSNAIKILIHGQELLLLSSNIFSEISIAIKESNRSLRTALNKIKPLLQAQTATSIEDTIKEWYIFLTYRNGNSHYTQDTRREKYLPAIDKRNIKFAKTILKLFFIILHQKKGALLTYKFTRPQGSTSITINQSLEFYSEILHPFLKIEADNPVPKGSLRAKPQQRILQTSFKVFLMSSIYSPEDLTLTDISALRLAQLETTKNGIIPLPITNILKTVADHFNNRMPIAVSQWLKEGAKAENLTTDGNHSYENLIKQCISKDLDALTTCKLVAVPKKNGVSSFSNKTIDKYNLTTSTLEFSPKFLSSYLIWLAAEDIFCAHHAREKDKEQRLAIGKINFYLFVYLPLWIKNNPNSKFKYPETPNEFSSAIHYNCKLPYSSERPLSLSELYKELGYIENNSNVTNIRIFFDFLIAEGADLDGCDRVRQPVTKIPKSINYSNVKKNVFTGQQLTLFIAYHQALESGCDFFYENSVKIKEVVDRAIKNNSFIDTEHLGYVPIIFLEGKPIPIKSLHPLTFSFVTHDWAPHYNPACVRFSLFLLECGVRGQTLQWIDADSYDRTSHRLSRDSLQLTTVWINTDKIHKTPFVIITSMSNLFLLDDQRRWRDKMIDNGVTGYLNHVFYDHDPKSNWGEILPLFASNPVTGSPITDSQYTRHWNYHCLNFQIWLKQNTTESKPIVGYLPKKRGPQRIFYTWEDWVDQKIKPDEVVVLHGNPNNKTYIADYCPVYLRAYATPHSARASFITDMSINLPPEAMTSLTGQTISTIIKYNKGHHLLHDRLKGAFNNKDTGWFLTNSFESSFSMRDAAYSLEELRNQGRLPYAIESLGLISSPSSPSPKEVTGLKLIATDRSLNLGVCYTHICPHNFICPDDIAIKFKGQKKCSQCQFAVYSIHNIAAIEAERQKLAEEYLSSCGLIEKYALEKNINPSERTRLQFELEQSAREIISWMVIEEMLWAHIVVRQSNKNLAERDLLAVDNNAVIQQVTRHEFKSDSVEGFLTRLGSACNYPDSLSTAFSYKIDRGTRLLMIKNDDVMGAAMMPSSFPNAVRLAGMIRSHLNASNLDIGHFVELINLTDFDWEKMLLSHHIGDNAS